MLSQNIFAITENEKIADKTFRMELSGDASAIVRPGQFVNIKLNGFFLRRPISVCDCTGSGLTLIYKTVGAGTEYMSTLHTGEKLDLLVGLGNGFDTSLSGDSPLLIAGGGGVPPMINLTKTLIGEGRRVQCVIGFNTAYEVYGERELRKLGAEVIVTTADGSYGAKGFVTDAVRSLAYSFFYTCGPLPMYKAIRSVVNSAGQYSFEERMGCGFGACMGCSIKTRQGAKRICKDGPVFNSEDIIWEELEK